MSKRITELPLATQLNTEDQFIFYSNSAKETQRVNAGISLNVIASNLPGVLKATTNASLGIANAALADAKAAEALANAATAQASAEGAQTSANGKAKVYYQSSAPTGGTYSTGDIWYDTDDNYKIYVRSGSSWVASFGPMLKLDGNNNISGLLKADGTDKSFVLVADNFQVWNGVSAEVPFEIVTDPSNPPNQVVRIKNAQIQTVDAGKITSGFISSQVVELANTDAYLQSSSFIETWTSGRVFRQKSLGKATPSDQLQCKVEQANGTFIVYDCLSTHTSSGASFPGVGGLWAATNPQPSSQSIGFRINGNGQAEFNGVNVRGNVIANAGYFGSGSDTIKIGPDIDPATQLPYTNGANGLTLGNKGYIKSAGLTYSGTSFTGSTSGFFLGNTQGYDQAQPVYQFFIGDPASNFLRWNGTNLIINGRIATGSTLGESGSGSSVNSQGGIIVGSTIGIRRNADNSVLTITGGTDNWYNSGAAQIDMQGKNLGGTNLGGIIQLLGGKTSYGKILLRTWNGDADNYHSCLAASTNGSVGINNESPNSSYKLDVNGAGRFTGELISSNITASISTYTVGLWDGGNNIRFKYEDGLYAKIDASDPILIVSPKLNLAASTILGEFTFGSVDYAGAVKTGTIAWDASGNNVTGQGVAIYRKGIVGADGTKVTFVIDTSGNATFGGTLSAPNGTIGGFTIDGKLYNQKTTLTDANNGVYLATDGIALGANSVFKVTSAGALTAASATITGAITATSGFIGTAADGFSINSTYIAKGKVSLIDASTGVYIGADGIALGASSVFKVTSAGALTASSGIIGGFTIGATSLTAGATNATAVGISTNSGTHAFFAGHLTPSSAPFRVTHTGELTATSVTVTGSITSTSGNIAGSTTIGNAGTSAVTVGGAINSSGIITSAALNEKLNATAGTIIGEFALTGSGALQIGTYSNGSSGDVRITPNGITARNNSGATTFSLVASTGDAVFKGDITGASGTFSGTLSATVGTIGGLTIAASRLHSGTKTALNDTVNGFYLGTDGVSLKGGTGAAALEIVSGRGRFTTRNTANEITGAFQGEDGVTGGSFLFLANSTGVDTISFFGQSGFGYFSTFYDKNDTNYYCNPASTSVFSGLDVGGYAVLTTNSGALTAGASTNLGVLQVNDWLTFDNSQTRLSISDDFGSGNSLTYAGGNNGHRWVNSGNSVQLADLDNSGNLSASSHPNYSSRRFKQNIRPIENALNTLKRLNGKIFDWKTRDLVNDIGFIAEEVNEVLPTLVNFDQDGQAKSLDYSRITALLTEAVKEQSGIISNLVTVIADLESRLKKLETN